MLQPRLREPMRALARFSTSFLFSSHQPSKPHSIFHPRINTIVSVPSLQQTFLSLLPYFQVRHASHATQGSANSATRDPAGKRLGAKKYGGQFVIPGNIIFRQRGTKWFPGENCGMGRDHTIYALETGYVRYYLDPRRHPKRQYIGVAFEKEDTLPYPRNAATKRRLGMVAVPRTEMDAALEENGSTGASNAGMKVKLVASKPDDSTANLPRPGYMYREANWEIGRAAEKAGIKVKEWNRKDRWVAWRKKLEKIQRIAQMKEMKSRGKRKAKAQN